MTDTRPCDGNPCRCPAANPRYFTVWDNPDAPLIERLDAHRGDGLCPSDVDGWDSRDPFCRACDLIDSLASALEHRDGPPPGWPTWLTPDWSSAHTTVENAIKAGTSHVYESADAAGMDWTYDGMVSCQASAVLGALKRGGWTPPSPMPPCPDPAPNPSAEWYVEYDTPDASFVSVDGGRFTAHLFDMTGDGPLPLGSNPGGGPLFASSCAVWTEGHGWVEVTSDEYARLGDVFGGWA